MRAGERKSGRSPGLSCGRAFPPRVGRGRLAGGPIDELNPERVLGTPNHATLVDAAMWRDPQIEFIRNCRSAYAGDPRAPIREVAQDAWARRFSDIDRCRRVPLNSKIVAPVAFHSRVPRALFLQGGVTGRPVKEGLSENRQCAG